MTDMEFMLGQPPSELMFYSWTYLCPVCALILAVASLATAQLPKLEDYEYPLWANLVGMAFVAIGLAMIPVFAVIELRNTGWDFRKAVRPRDNWGPKNLEQRMKYRLFMVERGYMQPMEAEALSKAEEQLRIAQNLALGAPLPADDVKPPVPEVQAGDGKLPSGDL
ncbi:unnamed protein product [Ixodes hexagonus]